MSALRSETKSSILVSVSTLSTEVSRASLRHATPPAGTYSTSNQLGVMIDAFGSKER